jgi:serine/threonine protein kinase
MKVKCNTTGKFYAAKIISKKDKNKTSTKNLVLEERRILRSIHSPYVYTFEELYEDETNFIVIL